MLSISLLKKSLLALTLFPMLQLAISVDAADTHEKLMGIQMHWRSDNKSADQLSLAIERLYVVLYNIGNLPTREIVDPNGRPVEKILRSEGLFYGSFFPVGVEAVMCDLNSELCSRPREKLPTAKLRGVANHVGGYHKTGGRWKNQSGSTLTVPDLAFERYTVLANVSFRPTDDPEKLVETQDADCSQWQVTCEDVVKKLNRALFDPKQKPAQRPKTAILPVTGVETDLVFTGTEGSKVTRILTDLGELRQRRFSLPLNRDQHFTEEWKTTIQKSTPADMAVKALSSQIISAGMAAPQSYFKDALYPDQKSLLALINHPFLNMDEIPPRFKKPIPIAVLDTWFDKEHCELKDNVELLSVTTAALSNRPKANECGAVMTMSPNIADDHGTHVAGIIASASNEKGVIGLNPYAKVNYIVVDAVRLMTPTYRTELANKIFSEAFGKALRTANISWRYSNQVTTGDPIQSTIQNLSQNTLFVVAAGNDAVSRDHACGELPACLSDKVNVITVVGLDRNSNRPQLWREDSQGSNWSKTFNIGAIAENVLSTTYHDYTGRFSGTSQAAPQVTAAASLLYSVHETHHRIDAPVLLPVRVKNRLIYTSDLFSELLDKMQGGRLNVERALDVARDFVLIEKAGERKAYTGTLVRFGNDKRSEYIECRRSNDQLVQIRRRDLRRMFYDEHRHKYIIFKNSESGNSNSPLDRITDCRLTTTSHIASIGQDGGTEVEFQFRDIRDYISAMF